MRSRFKTDTATLIVVDPACVRHRLDDDADWWSIPADEVGEVNRGNALFVNLGSDGVYELEVTAEDAPPGAKCADALIRNESGRFFVGAGEYMTGEGMESEAVYGNLFVERPPGTYRAVVWMTGTTLFVNLKPSVGPAGIMVVGREPVWCRPGRWLALRYPPMANTDLVPEIAIDYDEVFRRGGRNLGDEDFALFKCPSCGRIYLLEYEVDTAYLDPDDLSRRADVVQGSFDCVECGHRIPEDEPWIGPKAHPKFGVTWAELEASRWSWIARRSGGR